MSTPPQHEHEHFHTLRIQRLGAATSSSVARISGLIAGHVIGSNMIMITLAIWS